MMLRTVVMLMAVAVIAWAQLAAGTWLGFVTVLVAGLLLTWLDRSWTRNA